MDIPKKTYKREESIGIWEAEISLPVVEAVDVTQPW